MSDKCILVILGDVNSPEIVAVDEEWIEGRATELNVPDDHDPFDWLEKCYKEIHRIDTRDEVCSFCGDGGYKGRHRQFIIDEVMLMQDDLND